MSLARLRMDLDLMPSPVEDRPGLFVRDPFRYSEAQLIIPPPLVTLLRFFDGETPALEVRHALVRSTGDLRAGEVLDQLSEALDEAGFLENDRFREMQDLRQREFAAASIREASHAGPGGYPADLAELQETFGGYLQESSVKPGEDVVGIAAPHVSPFGGWECYADAYRAIPASAAEKTFVVLGTSHYGAPDCFGLTRKAFKTPFGCTQPALDLIDELERTARPSVLMEDYCHAVEHSIEFQVAFLQHRFGPDIRVLPILCGSFAESILQGHLPERNDRVSRMFDSLAEIQARESDRLFWVLGIDMAHIGSRYDGSNGVSAFQDEMLDVQQRDHHRIRAIEQSSASEFWSKVQENNDDLNWCGSSPVYTFLKSVAPALVGETLRYGQWNIDPESVVSFAAMRFKKKP
jgi:AmmeMemoRadiSam system protein B